MALGAKTGGRVKGSTNKTKGSIALKLAGWKCDPFHVLAQIALGDLPCNVCRGKGKTRYQAASDGDRTFERVCQSCYGSKWERISPAERAKASSDLAKYIQPTLASMQVSGPEGDPIAIRVIFGKE